MVSMRIEGDYFYITPAEVEAGCKVTPTGDWNRACNSRTWIKTAANDLHFMVPGMMLPGFLDALKDTASLPEDDTQTCINGSGDHILARELARSVLGALEVELIS